MLRAWEGKHIEFPQRIVCGDRAYRRYSQAQINLIAKIKEYRDQGYTLSTAAQKAKAECVKKANKLWERPISK
jgi:DNA-binding transcriptional MerR regulator